MNAKRFEEIKTTVGVGKYEPYIVNRPKIIRKEAIQGTTERISFVDQMQYDKMTVPAPG